LSCLVLSCLVLSCLVLSCLALPCLVLSCLVLPCLVLSCLVLCPVFCLVLSCHQGVPANSQGKCRSFPRNPSPPKHKHIRISHCFTHHCFTHQHKGRMPDFIVETLQKNRAETIQFEGPLFREGHEVMTIDAHNIKHILKDNVNNYIKVSSMICFIGKVCNLMSC
jgi:hypothetical protein